MAVIAHGKEIAYSPAHGADCHFPGSTNSVFKLEQEPALVDQLMRRKKVIK